MKVGAIGFLLVQAICVEGEDVSGALDRIHAWERAHGHIQAGPARRGCEAAAPFQHAGSKLRIRSGARPGHYSSGSVQKAARLA